MSRSWIDAMPPDVESLQREKRKLEEALSSLLAKTESDKEALAFFYEFEFKLLVCVTLSELFELLIEQGKIYFNLDAISLILHDQDQSMQDIIDPSSYEGRLQFRSKLQFFEDLYGETKNVLLGPLDILEKSKFFSGNLAVESSALLPLVRQGQFIGSFHLGSSDISRFSRDKDTKYITHMASIISVCIENCLARENLRRLSLIDALTKVKNRRAFEDDMEEEVARAGRTGEPLSFLFIDLDHFKKINDSYGHHSGDEALRTVAAAVKTQLRKTDQLSRYGGEEFSVLLPNCTGKLACEIAERVREKVEDTVIHAEDNTPFNLTLSVGVTTWEASKESDSTFEELRDQIVLSSDHALYFAKKQGRNRVVFEALRKN